MSEIKLKPCPFCDGINIKLFVFEVGNVDYIKCEDCHISIEYINDIKIDRDIINTKKKVLANKWNTRKYKEEIDEKNN